MAQTREACWHFQCPTCGFGDREFGQLATAAEIHCSVCFEEDGRYVRLRRWAAVVDTRNNQARLRGALAAA